jgi:Flp pilus assembly protein TadD
MKMEKNMTTERKTVKKLLLCTAALGLLFTLPACTSASSRKQHEYTLDKIDTVLAQAANEAAASGKSKESLTYMEKLYTRHPENPDVALGYAQLLKKAGYMRRATLVLAPLATPKNPDRVNLDAVIEFASIHAAMGEYEAAEKHARRAIALSPDNGKAYHVLGIVLDAQGIHEDAESALRRALDHWEGDPTPVMNNLGLNLAAQGYIDQALDILRKAQAAAPQRREIERNLRIVSALQTQPNKKGPRLVPFPPRRPEQENVTPTDKTKETAKKDKEAALIVPEKTIEPMHRVATAIAPTPSAAVIAAEKEEELRRQAHEEQMRLARIEEEQKRAKAEKARLAKIKAQKEAEEKARLAALKAKQEAEEKARFAELKAKEEAEEKARLAALKAKEEAEAEAARLAKIKEQEAEQKHRKELHLARMANMLVSQEDIMTPAQKRIQAALAAAKAMPDPAKTLAEKMEAEITNKAPLSLKASDVAQLDD